MSTRLIIKNLPRHLTDERFREHFSSQGEVTDAKIMKNSFGISRRFGYIGYRTTKEAKKALAYFKDTYLDTSKLVVEFAKGINDPSLPRPWSRYSAGSSASERLESKSNSPLTSSVSNKPTNPDQLNGPKSKSENSQVNIFQETNTDPQLREFLEVMAPRSKSRAWANDDALPQVSGIGVKDNTRDKKKKKDEIKAKVEIATVQSRKTGGEGVMLKRTHVKFGDDDGDDDNDNNNNDDDDDYEDLPGKGEQDIEDYIESEEEIAKKKENDDEDDEDDEGDEEDKDDVVKNDSISDLEYLKSRMTLKDDEMDVDDEENEEDAEDENIIAEEEAEDKRDENKDGDPPNESETKEEVNKPQLADSLQAKFSGSSGPSGLETLEPEALISDTGRLFIRNLPYACSESDIRAMFEKFGPLSEIHMPIDRETKKPKGYAYVLYLLPEHALAAYKALDKCFFMGRLLHILPAQEKPMPKEDIASQNGARLSTVKKEKDLKRKKESGNSFNWNSLYMSQDAIASSIADRLGVSKSDILSPDADNLAVRLALAETTIVADTKTFLEQHGVVISQFGRKERSDTVVLVKNIPFGTTEQELQDLFGKHGDLGRVLIPPTGTIAIVEFLEPAEARVAFNALAYRKFKDSLLYLEKAPIGVFRDKFTKNNSKDTNGIHPTKTQGKRSITSKDWLEGGDGTSTGEVDVNLENVEGATLFVKNLNFATTEESLRNAFSNIRGFRASQVRWKNDTKRPGEKLSMGFGFVEFTSKELASAALKAMQGFILDGHALQIKFSSRGGDETEPTKSAALSKGKGTKLIVRNVPFEATKKDIRDLFGSYGQLKSVRLPKKFTGGHRGFAFLDFMTQQEAQNVFDHMSSIHLYGRHLVLEWAEMVADIETLRERTGRQFARQEDGRNSKRKKVDLDGKADDGGMGEGDDMSD